MDEGCIELGTAGSESRSKYFPFHFAHNSYQRLPTTLEVVSSFVPIWLPS